MSSIGKEKRNGREQENFSPLPGTSVSCITEHGYMLTHSRANAFCLHLQLCVAAVLSGLDTAHVMACGEIPSFMVSCAEGCPEPFRLPETLTASFSNTMLFFDIWSRDCSEISVVTAFQRYVPRAALERLISTALHESVSLAFPKVCHTTRLRKRCMYVYIYIYIYNGAAVNFPCTCTYLVVEKQVTTD